MKKNKFWIQTNKKEKNGECMATENVNEMMWHAVKLLMQRSKNVMPSVDYHRLNCYRKSSIGGDLQPTIWFIATDTYRRYRYDISSSNVIYITQIFTIEYFIHRDKSKPVDTLIKMQYCYFLAHTVQYSTWNSNFNRTILPNTWKLRVVGKITNKFCLCFI